MQQNSKDCDKKKNTATWSGFNALQLLIFTPKTWRKSNIKFRKMSVTPQQPLSNGMHIATLQGLIGMTSGWCWRGLSDWAGVTNMGSKSRHAAQLLLIKRTHGRHLAFAVLLLVLYVFDFMKQNFFKLHWINKYDRGKLILVQTRWKASIPDMTNHSNLQANG